MKTRIGLVGYGSGGRLFHAPYIVGARTCELAGIVARAEATIATAESDYPDVPIFASLGDMLDSGRVDAVSISTPPHTRRELVLEAITQGVPTIADKPFAPNAEAGQALADEATRRSVLLNAFHNRRYDTDFVTARAVRDSGELGPLRGLDIRFDLDEPESLEGGPTGGLLRDLGSHVVDQALQLLGPARTVSAHLSWTDLAAGQTDSGFAINIEHESGAYSRISASKVDHLISKEIRLFGRDGSYVSDYRDVQTDAVKAGRRPRDGRTEWGYEDESRWGLLRRTGQVRPIPSLQGDYCAYFEAFAEAVRTGGPGPVPAQQAVEVLRVLDAVTLSDRESRTVTLA